MIADVIINRNSGRPMRSPSTDRVEVPFSARFHFARSGRHPDGTPVEGLQMGWPGPPIRARVSGFEHRPVMLDEIVEILRVVPPGVLLDATLGGGGHSAALLAAAPQLELVGVDQDPDAIEAASATLAGFGDRVHIVRSRFDRLGEVLDSLGRPSVSAFLFDLGVSSHQFDEAGRGFSYRFEGALDMRMDPDRPFSADDVVNGWSESQLTSLLIEHGERRFARRISRAIIAARPVTTTAQLAETVRNAIPAAARRHGGHPAKRTFQAVRVAVNEELDILPGAIDAVLARLAPGGRGAVLSYHSGEDRIVKDRFREAATGGCVCPPGLPCVCGAEPAVKLLFRGSRQPSAAEIEVNHRAESARLRVVEALS